ncbi:hypothetical protein BBJ29_010086 [Phytophthora kernoviae]|uniref:RxLR effector protein n=1 Tax=Phytophthora kernoviae TaxID=325452 RepID=A0A421G4E8_9STRA|nr:hypothetical protein BBJ29_010086 [Phytophthora kernoviae]
MLISVDSCVMMWTMLLSKVDSVHSASVINGNGNDDGNRFLRTSKAIEDDDDDSKEDLEDDTEDGSEDEERSFMDIFKNLPFNKLDDIDDFKNAPLSKLDDIAKDLANTNPAALKELKAQNVKSFMEIKELGWTPKSMAEKLDIAGKQARKTEDQLNNDPFYLLWLHYSKFWDAGRAKT